MLKIRAPYKGAFIFYPLTVDNTQKKGERKNAGKIESQSKKVESVSRCKLWRTCGTHGDCYK